MRALTPLLTSLPLRWSNFLLLIYASSLFKLLSNVRTLPMGLLDQLWDDTVAGPPPDSGLGKLRKQKSLGFRPSSGKELSGGGRVGSYGDEATEEAVRVTRSIMIVKPPGYRNDSPPVSPAGSTPPVSPFSGSRESFRFRRRSASDAYEKTSKAGPRSPTSPYDV